MLPRLPVLLMLAFFHYPIESLLRFGPRFALGDGCISGQVDILWPPYVVHYPSGCMLLFISNVLIHSNYMGSELPYYCAQHRDNMLSLAATRKTEETGGLKKGDKH